MGKNNFSKKIINWYHDSHRHLPWRETNDPYRIWLSEIILQQTRVAQGLPYYQNFIKNFPTVSDLAGASEQKVLRAWQGLGYYSRARNLHACAKKIVAHFAGKFPTTYVDLLKLPGIGPYTAAAIASLSYGEPVAVVDGNVFRVLSRVFGIEDEIDSARGKNNFSQLANSLLDRLQPGLHNQAVMEFGALHCTPKSPKCAACIFFVECVARKRGIQDLLPLKKKQIKVRTRHFTYFILKKGNALALKRRMGKDIWKGLYDFYLVETKRNQKIERMVEEDKWLKKLSEMSTVEMGNRKVKHVLTHQKIYARFVLLDFGKSFQPNGWLKNTDLKLYSLREIRLLPKPILISRFLDEKGY